MQIKSTGSDPLQHKKGNHSALTTSGLNGFDSRAGAEDIQVRAQIYTLKIVLV